MPEGNSYSSIGPLNATAQKEGLPLAGMILLDMVLTIVGLFVVGYIANML